LRRRLELAPLVLAEAARDEEAAAIVDRLAGRGSSRSPAQR
jgi:hypothetical protein